MSPLSPLLPESPSSPRDVSSSSSTSWAQLLLLLDLLLEDDRRSGEEDSSSGMERFPLEEEEDSDLFDKHKVKNILAVAVHNQTDHPVYRVTHLVANLGWVDLGSSPGWWPLL